jgi:hypothetical protein
MELQEPDRVAQSERTEMKSHSVQKHQGHGMMRWSDYKKVDGVRKRYQPFHMIAWLKTCPKKKEIRCEAAGGRLLHSDKTFPYSSSQCNA